MPYRTDSIDDLRRWHRGFIEQMGWANSKTPLECVALICEEIGELTHELRMAEIDKEAAGFELADIMLRTMDLASELDIDIEGAVFQKICHNFDNIEKIKAKDRVV